MSNKKQPKTAKAKTCKQCSSTKIVNTGFCREHWNAYVKERRLQKKEQAKADKDALERYQAQSCPAREALALLSSEYNPVHGDVLIELFKQVVRLHKIKVFNYHNPEADIPFFRITGCSDALFNIEAHLEKHSCEENPENIYYRDKFQPWQKLKYGIPCNIEEERELVQQNQTTIEKCTHYQGEEHYRELKRQREEQAS